MPPKPLKKKKKKKNPKKKNNNKKKKLKTTLLSSLKKTSKKSLDPPPKPGSLNSMPPGVDTAKLLPLSGKNSPLPLKEKSMSLNVTPPLEKENSPKDSLLKDTPLLNGSLVDPKTPKSSKLMKDKET